MNFSDAELKALGLTRDSLPEVLNPAGNSSPAVQAAQTPKPVRPSHAAFVEPSWYPLTRYAMTSPSERGCMLFGPRGCGKSYTIRHLAHTEDAQTVTLQCAANMQIDSLIGCWTAVNGETAFVDGPLTIAVRTGAWLLAEEANVIHPGVWSAVNTLTDKTGEGLRLPTGEVVPNHDDFRLCLLFNEGSQYAGTRDVNAALKRRLVPVYATYPEESQECQIIGGLTGAASVQVAKVVSCARMIRAADSLRFDLSPDILARWINVVLAGIADWQTAYRMCVMDLLGAPEQTVAQRAILTEIGKNCGMEKW